uniref:Uncharacterized protein n=1 Tax=Arundo donax TaxID=35708 RepID=A0A0A9A4E2_ARUDO
MKAEISGVSRDGLAWRYAVNLLTRSCSCGQWDVTGKPCTHAIAYICSLRNLKVEHYVNEYYSVQRFKDTYQFEVNPMGDKSQWPTLDPGFEMRPPKLERPGGRPMKKSIKSSGEPGKRGPYQCQRCFQYGHIEKGCTYPQIEPDEDLPEPPPTRKKRARGSATQEENPAAKKSRKKKGPTVQAQASILHATPSPPSSPGVVTRRRAAMSPSSPSSPGAVTRRKAAMSPMCSSPLAGRNTVAQQDETN